MSARSVDDPNSRSSLIPWIISSSYVAGKCSLQAQTAPRGFLLRERKARYIRLASSRSDLLSAMRLDLHMQPNSRDPLKDSYMRTRSKTESSVVYSLFLEAT